NDPIHRLPDHPASENVSAHRHAFRHVNPVHMLGMLEIAEPACSSLQVVEGNRIDIGLQLLSLPDLRGQRHDIGLICRNMLLQVAAQAFITRVDKSSLYPAQHDGFVNIEYVSLQVFRIFDGLFAIAIMVSICVDDDLAKVFVIADLMAKDDARIVKIVALGSVNAADFTHGIWRVDPINGDTIPPQPDIRYLDVVHIEVVLGYPRPCIAGYHAREPMGPISLFDLPHQVRHIVKHQELVSP